MLRLKYPEKYGVKGTREGDKGYVKNGWRSALSDAAAARRANKVGGSRLSAEQQAVHADYLAELHLLQARYFPRLGRELSNKAKAASVRIGAAQPFPPPVATLRPAAAVVVDPSESEGSPVSDQTTEVMSTTTAMKKPKRVRHPTVPAISSS